MKQRLPRFPLLILLLGSAVLLSAPNRCREDYVIDFGRIKPTATPTEEGEETATPTPTGTATITPTVDATVSITPTVSATETPEEALVALRELASSAAAPVAARGGSENWLGRAFIDEDFPDRDGDGFSDELESAYGTDPDVTESVPVLRQLLRNRMKGFDGDSDGVSDADEARHNLDPRVSDSDGDGASDGAEILSGTDPRSPSDRPDDRDGDGLDSIYEETIGLNPDAADTDRDGLRDDREMALGALPLVRDTDGDGALDGAEVLHGYDPTLPEPRG